MKDIIDYLDNKPLEFDFTDDCTESTEYKMKKGYEKFFIYRSSKHIGDPDSRSKLLQDIYSLLWPEIKEQKREYMLNRNEWICSDTMVSVQSVLNSYVKNKGQWGKRISGNKCIELYETDSAFKDLLDENKNLERLMSVYHTIGNYIPVAYGFNTARSGYFGSHDYWDLTLMKIKDYYDAKSGSVDFINLPEFKIMELLHCDSKVICCCKWLDDFHGWDDFIERNFLQDFVDEKKQPLQLCEGHSWKCIQVQDFDKFFETTCECIEKRGEKMINKLKKLVEN